VRFESDRSYHLPMSPWAVWDEVSKLDDFRTWWPWLRHFEGTRLVEDDVWRCTVRPPLPYAVRFEVSLDEVRPPSSVRASLAGDVVGEARLSITSAEEGSEVRLVSSLEPGNGLLRALARVAAPVARYGHDWVFDTGARQFLGRPR